MGSAVRIRPLLPVFKKAGLMIGFFIACSFYLLIFPATYLGCSIFIDQRIQRAFTHYSMAPSPQFLHIYALTIPYDGAVTAAVGYAALLQWRSKPGQSLPRLGLSPDTDC